MNLYIDESGSINNTLKDKPFVISVIHVLDFKKLNTAYKRFISSNIKRLQELDKDFINEKGILRKKGNQMFQNGKFKELKGSQFDQKMRNSFVEYFSRNKYLEIFYVKINNNLLTDKICENTARAFNYSLKLALSYFIQHKKLPDQDCLIQLDERNERTEAKFFLETYLNTELCLNNITDSHFTVKYLDSSTNPFVQIADVFANLYYAELKTGTYTDAINVLKEKDILKGIFEFPPDNNRIDNQY